MSEFELLNHSLEQQQINELDETDDWSSSWQKCLELGKKWGGRGMGGRATGRTTLQTKDVVVEGCTLAYMGTNLLERTTLRLLSKHRYGLIGRNGVGKSTLMRRIASGTLPGFPPHLKVAQVSQELPYIDARLDINPIKYVIEFNPFRRAILKRIDEIENSGEDSGNIEEEANELESLYDLLEDEGRATARAVKILKELGFGPKRREMSLHKMSGGWKMRAAIACALAQEPDILLLDEPTNHLDLEGVEWLKSYLIGPSAEELTILITSHDRNFLDDVCTDIIRFYKRQLHYYPGNYSQYEIASEEKQTSLKKTQDGIDKQRKQIEESIKKMQIQASKDTSGRGFGMIASRKKKLARHGAEKNELGHRFKAQLDSTKGGSSIRAGSRNETSMGYKTGASRTLVDAAEKEWKMVLPDPIPLPIMGSCSCIQIQDAQIGYYIDPSQSDGTNGEEKQIVALKDKSRLEFKSILNNVTLNLEQSSKIAIVGKNGCGKRLLYEHGTDVSSKSFNNIEISKPYLIKGEISKHPLLKIAYYQQHQQESLPYELSPLQHLTNIANEKNKGVHAIDKLDASKSEQETEQSIRAHLGSFGLGGDLALQPIGLLSGGQKARVVLAELTFLKPHVLFLDEPTNNLDLDSVKALKDALIDFKGACIVASHDMAFVKETSTTIYHLHQEKLTRLENGVDEYKKFVADSVASQKRKRK